MTHSYCGIILSLLLLTCKHPSSEQSKSPYLKDITTARDSTHLPLSQREALLDSTYGKIQSLPTDSLKLHLLSEVSRAYLSLNDTTQFGHINNELLQSPYAQNYPKTLGNAHAQRGLLFIKQGKSDSAFYHYCKALQNYRQLPLDSTGHFLRGRMLYDVGKIQGMYNNFLRAEATIVAAIKHFRKAGNDERLYACHTVLGVIALAMDQPNKALREFRQAKSYLERAHFPEKELYQWYLQNNMAAVHFETAAYGKAQTIYTSLLHNKALPKANPEFYTKVMTNQAYTYFKGSHNIPKAQAMLEQAMALNDSLQFWHDQPRTQRYYAELLVAQGDTPGALCYAKAARDLAQSTFNTSSLLEALQLLTRIDPSQSTHYMADYHALSSKLQQQEQTQPEKFARLRLEAQDLMAENKQLTRKGQVQQIVTAELFAFAVAGGVTLILVYRTIRARLRKIKVAKSRMLHS